MNTYYITIEVQTSKRLTEDQRDTMREEVLRALDEDANLPLDADVVTATVEG